MFRNDFKKIVCAIVLFGLAVVAALADAPYEQYHVIYDDIAQGVLENTIGILTINSGKSNELKIYAKTGEIFSSAFAVISKDKRQFRWLKIIDQKAEFIQVGTVRYSNDQPKIVPLGWIRIRDDEKRLMIWIRAEDTC